MTEVYIYPNDDDPRKEQPNPFSKLDDLLKANTKPGEEAPTVRELAEEVGIDDLTKLSNFQERLDRVIALFEETGDDPWTNRLDVSLVRLILSEVEEEEKPERTVFDEINSYLKREAPEDIENPTVQGIAERMGISEGTINSWLETDEQFKKELTELKEHQERDPYKTGTVDDYFFHSSGVQFVLEETKKRWEPKG